MEHKKGSSSSILIIITLTVHAFLMNGYYTNHPHLTVATYFSPIKAQVDPSLFQNSIFVQAVNRTQLMISAFYDLAPFLLRFISIESLAIAQNFISLFFMLAGIFTITKKLFDSTAAACIACFLYTPALNNWTLGAPAPYLNFFHYALNFAYPLILWSLIFFLQKRFHIAFFLAGVSWAFHTMCTSFLLCAYATYWVFNIKEFPIKRILLCSFAFLIPALPYLIKTFNHLGASSAAGPLWFEGVRWVAWYSCFPATWPPSYLIRAGLFFVLSLACLFQITDRSIKQFLLPTLLAVALLCLAGCIFADFYPIPLVIKMSLWRSTILYLFLALPCIAFTLTKSCNQTPARQALAIILCIMITCYVEALKLYYFPALILLLLFVLYGHLFTKKLQLLHTALSLLLPCILTAFVFYQFFHDTGAIELVLFAFFVAAVLLSVRLFCPLPLHQKSTTRLFALGFFWILVFDAAVLYKQGGAEIYFNGKKFGALPPWNDIQQVARRVSDKDDVFIVPPSIPGFTNYSLRATLGDWAEGSTLLYLDNRFTEEWFERMRDLGWHSPFGAENGYNSLSTEAILATAQKYDAKFIVTKKPKRFALQHLYENEQFILYRALLSLP